MHKRRVTWIVAMLAWVVFACAAVTAQSVPASAPASAPATFAAADLDRRVEAYEPYDGAGRYVMARDDGVRSVQGLLALARRYGAKPYGDLATAPGAWATERVIFRDVDTGAAMMRMTNDPWADQLSYFQGNWSADGRTIVFRRRPGMWEGSTGTHGPMAMNADGTGLRNVFRDFPLVRGEVCSPTDPNVCFAMTDSDRKVVAFDLATGKSIRVVHEGGRNWHLKVSLDGKYLISRSDLSTGVKGLWVASADGKEQHEIPAPEAIHDSYRVHPSRKKVMFWYESKVREEGFVQCDFDGGNLTKVNMLFDWNHGEMGPDRGIHCEGYITRIQGDTWGPKERLYAKEGEEYYDDPHDYNGYSTWWPKDRPWAYHTRIVRRPVISEIQAAAVEPAADFRVNRYRVCFTGLQRGRDLDNPNASPDGTKVLFNSNMLGRADIYCVVARLPEPPVDLTSSASDGRVDLKWKPAAHAKEIAAYHVYRSERSGRGFVPVTTQPVKGTEYTDTDIPKLDAPGRSVGYVYAVTAVEHSGLESLLSEETYAGKGDPKSVVCVEPELAAVNTDFWIAFHGPASNLHYLWMRKKGGQAKAELKLPALCAQPERPQTLWARVRGTDGAKFTVSVAGKSVEIAGPPTRAWTWVKAAGTLEVKDAGSVLTLTGAHYGSAIDCLVLTGDGEFDPAKAQRVVWPAMTAPEGLAAKALSPYAASLEWKPAEGATFHHYNVYCGEREDFAPSQGALVGSPDAPRLVDWGLRPGSTLHYRVTCVDRAGNESPASAAAKVATPAVAAWSVQKDFQETLDFDVPAKDTYVVWLRLLAARAGQGSYIDVRVDGKGGGSWVAGPDGTSQEYWLTYDQWGRFDLAAGKHTLTIQNKSGRKIEKVLVTNDLSHVPPGHVNILTGW